MEQQPSEPEIEKLLEELNSQDSRQRWQAARKVRDEKINDERIVARLNALVSADKDETVRNSARWALNALGLPVPPLDPVLARWQRDFWTGLLLFYVINGMMFLFYLIVGSGAIGWGDLNLGNPTGSGLSAVIAFLVFLINIGLLVFLAFKRPRMAFGMLVGFGLVLVVVLCMWLFVAVVCYGVMGIR